jgi:hypothetical protein
VLSAHDELLLVTLQDEQRRFRTGLEDIGDSTNQDGYDNQRDTGFNHHQKICSVGQWKGVCWAKRCRSCEGHKEIVDKIWGPLLAIAILLLRELQVYGFVVRLMPLAWPSAIDIPVPESKYQYLKHPQ